MTNQLDELRRRAMALHEERKRRQSVDPLLGFQPHKVQKKFLDAILERKRRTVLYLGANRSGKSDAGAAAGAHLARFGHREPRTTYSGSGDTAIEVRDRATSGWVVGLDWPTLRSTIQPKYFDNGFRSPGAHEPFIPEREIVPGSWSKVDQTLKLRNGSLIEFKSADSTATKFQGSGKDWIHFDEAPPRPVYEEATIRVEAGRMLQVFLTATLLPPLGRHGGVSWVYSEFVRPWKRGDTPHIDIYSAGIRDNPYIGLDEISYLEAMFPEGSPARAIRLDGALLPGISGARAYPRFERDINMREQEIHERAPLCWTWDFNVQPMVTLVGQRYDGVFRFCREYVLYDGGNVPDMVDLFLTDWRDWGGQLWLYGDATGANRNSQTGNSDYVAIMNTLRPHGFTIRRKVRTKNPPQSERLNAVNRQINNEYGVVNIEVDPQCEFLIADFEEVLMDPAGGIRKSSDMGDPYFNRTHASDAAGYWIEYEMPIRYQRQMVPDGKLGAFKQVGYGFAAR